jgi:O-antigen biosynthesis protein WbqP
VILTPFFLIIPVLIKLESPGPVFIGFSRIGRNGLRFEMVVFRTIRFSGHASGPRFQVTRMGAFLRSFGMESIPQLLNILRGDMTIVGPPPAKWE